MGETFSFQARNLFIAPADLGLGFCVTCVLPPPCGAIPCRPQPGKTGDALEGTAGFSAGCSVHLLHVFWRRNGSKVGAASEQYCFWSRTFPLGGPCLAPAMELREGQTETQTKKLKIAPLECDGNFHIRKTFNVMALYSQYFSYALLWGLYIPHKYEI